MKVINFPNKIEEKDVTLILGGFSTFHIGHMKLVEKAKEQNNKIALMLFDEPENLPNKTSEIFEELAVRLQKAANLKIDFALVLKADKDTLFISADDFITQIKTNYNPKNIICGKEFKFGHMKKGTILDLQKSFETIIVEPKKIANKKLSSGVIKEQIAFGEIEFCNSLLSEPWTTLNTVKRDNTFNFKEKQIKPHNGIYAIEMLLDNMMYHGCASIDEQKHTLKFLNFNKEIQNKVVKIRWIKELKISIKLGDSDIKQKHLDLANELFKSRLKK